MRSFIFQLIKRHSFCAGLVFSLLLTIAIFPDFFTLKRFPLFGYTWEIADPAVSDLVVVPSFRAAKYELLNHHNVLWTNLRGHGLPIPGNEIQGAPLFPLTLASYFVPEPYVWNLMVIARIILLGSASFLVASQVFALSILGSAVLTLSFAFSIFLLRYLNHPFQNGIYLGLFYLFAIIKLADFSNLSRRSRLPFQILLIIIVYGLVTSGFPEGALSGGTLAVIVGLPLIISRARRGSLRWLFFSDLLACHAIGFALSSAQIFSVLEFLRLEAPGFRMTMGQAQWPEGNGFWSLVTRVTHGPPAGPIIHFFFLIPIFLCLSGLWTRARSLRPSALDVSAILAMLFFVLKTVPGFPLFNSLLNRIPYYQQSFYLYFFPLFLLGFGYFAAKGAEALFAEKESKVSPTTFWILISVVLSIFYIAVERHADAPKYCVNQLYFFVAFFVFYLSPIRNTFRYFLVCLLIFEITNGMPRHFLLMDSPEYESRYSFKETANEISRQLSVTGHSRWDFRERSWAGLYTPAGIASFDNGASAILPERTALYRELVFEPMAFGWNGKWPLRAPQFPYSWQLSGVGIFPGQWSPTGIIAKSHTSVSYDFSGLPRSYLADRCIVANDVHSAAKALSNPQTFSVGSAVIENLSPAEIEWCRTTPLSLAKLRILKDSGSAIAIEEVKGPAILVLSDSYYPGWKAEDFFTGEPLEIKPTNVAFRSLLLKENRKYLVHFKYEPNWLKISYWLVLLGGLGLLVMVILTMVETWKLTAGGLSDSLGNPLTNC